MTLVIGPIFAGIEAFQGDCKVGSDPVWCAGFWPGDEGVIDLIQERVTALVAMEENPEHYCCNKEAYGKK